MIAEVDEQQSAVVAFAMNPARELDCLADLRWTKDGAGMRSISVRFAQEGLTRDAM
jgi:hypothetical protein